jgi:hypothetical protein
MRLHVENDGAEKRTPVARKADGVAGPANMLSPKGVLDLQRTAGNAAVTSELMLQRVMHKNVSGDLQGSFSKKDGADSFNINGGWIDIP